MKYILTFLAGAATGALGVYLYLNNKIDKKVEEAVSKEMDTFFKRQESMQQRLEEEAKRKKEDEEIYKECYESFTNLYASKDEEKEKEPERSSIIELNETEFTSYRNDEYEDDDEEEITDEEMEALMEDSRKRCAEGPHIVSEDNDECMAYDKEELTYYPEDCLLVNIYGQEVEYPDAYFGSVDWKKELADKDKIIIRNPEEATDYIVYNDNYYNYYNK